MAAGDFLFRLFHRDGKLTREQFYDRLDALQTGCYRRGQERGPSLWRFTVL